LGGKKGRRVDDEMGEGPGKEKAGKGEENN
jgi:hypothetical protein